LKILN